MKIFSAFILFLTAAVPMLSAAPLSDRQQMACAIDKDSAACRQLIQMVHAQQTALQTHVTGVPLTGPESQEESLVLPGIGQGTQDPAQSLLQSVQ